MKPRPIAKSAARAPLAYAVLPKTYAELVRILMPRPLHDKVDYRNALGVLDALAGHKLTRDQEDFFDAIATFVEKYESEKHAIETPNLSPIDLLRSLVEEHGMTESDLGRLLGDRSLGHRILAGQRDLSKVHIRTLAAHFALDPAALL
jgi:HTH-type transcriptional regulator/antitoxin HigA